jgi:hypothetical protein
VLTRRGAYEEAQRWCDEVRAALREEDLADAIGVDAMEGFLVAQRGGLAEGERLTRRAAERAAEIDHYDIKSRVYEWRARTLAIAGEPAEAREAAAIWLSFCEAKGDVSAIGWARGFVDSLSA